MAKVKIQGHASGTGILTVTAPDTDENRTITLPDATGTLLNSDGSAASLTSIPAANITGTLPAIDGSNLTGLSSFDPDGAVTINDTGADVDFRVESDTDAYAFEVNGVGGKTGIGCGATVTGLANPAPNTFLYMHGDENADECSVQIGNRSAANSDDESVSLHLACSVAGKGVRLVSNREGDFTSAANSSSSFNIYTNNQNSWVTALSLSATGALSKASGSFRIDHPLPEKKDTHHLVHSFVESPRADLIYRGKATLVDGSATINIDTAAGMTEGTFVLLCDDVQCFTSNESDWDAVKGSVPEEVDGVGGNILTIECENSSSTAEIAWMVVGDRKDEHIMDTEWTDEYGKPIVEPTKP